MGEGEFGGGYRGRGDHWQLSGDGGGGGGGDGNSRKTFSMIVSSNTTLHFWPLYSVTITRPPQRLHFLFFISFEGEESYS